MDNILYQEDLAQARLARVFGDLLSNLADRASGILRARLSEAAADVGSYWYTAWTAAGRPQLK